MKTKNGFTAMSVGEFGAWLANQKVSREIARVQMHHTYQPDYKAWNGSPDAFYWQKGMRDYHVNSNGWADIAQHFTICPDGTIITGRSLNSNPAGIVGANTAAICIECFGNFDSDDMRPEQADAIVGAVALILKRFGLPVNAITYHAWWSASGSAIGTYDPSRSAKTCPGKKFFGGNTREAYNSNFALKVAAAMAGVNKKEEIDMEQLNALKKTFEDYRTHTDDIINTMGKEIDTLKKSAAANGVNNADIYNYNDKNIPAWCKQAVDWATEKGVIQGDENGKLGLTPLKLWVLTVVYRAAKVVCKMMKIDI